MADTRLRILAPAVFSPGQENEQSLEERMFTLKKGFMFFTYRNTQHYTYQHFLLVSQTVASWKVSLLLID
jgi:hypothetical protein